MGIFTDFSNWVKRQFAEETTIEEDLAKLSELTGQSWETFGGDTFFLRRISYKNAAGEEVSIAPEDNDKEFRWLAVDLIRLTPPKGLFQKIMGNKGVGFAFSGRSIVLKAQASGFGLAENGKAITFARPKIHVIEEKEDEIIKIITKFSQAHESVQADIAEEKREKSYGLTAEQADNLEKTEKGQTPTNHQLRLLKDDEMEGSKPPAGPPSI